MQVMGTKEQQQQQKFTLSIVWLVLKISIHIISSSSEYCGNLYNQSTNPQWQVHKIRTLTNYISIKTEMWLESCSVITMCSAGNHKAVYSWKLCKVLLWRFFVFKCATKDLTPCFAHYNIYIYFCIYIPQLLHNTHQAWWVFRSVCCPQPSSLKNKTQAHCPLIFILPLWSVLLLALI